MRVVTIMMAAMMAGTAMGQSEMMWKLGAEARQSTRTYETTDSYAEALLETERTLISGVARVSRQDPVGRPLYLDLRIGISDTEVPNGLGGSLSGDGFQAGVKLHADMPYGNEKLKTAVIFSSEFFYDGFELTANANDYAVGGTVSGTTTADINVWTFDIGIGFEVGYDVLPNLYVHGTPYMYTGFGQISFDRSTTAQGASWAYSDEYYTLTPENMFGFGLGLGGVYEYSDRLSIMAELTLGYGEGGAISALFAL